MKAICLVSGGMDSLVTAAIAHQECQELYFLHLNYGQKTEDRELRSFSHIARHYQVPSTHQKVVKMNFLKSLGGSSLTDEDIPVKDFKGDDDSIPDSYVPFRNTHIIALAVSWAEIVLAQRIYIGAVYEDSSGYPDCRPEYYKAFNQLIKVGTKYQNLEIITPLIHLSKKEIVQKAVELKAPLDKSWSCYAKEDKACGVCDSCALRLRGFKQAGVQDPLPYEAKGDG